MEQVSGSELDKLPKFASQLFTILFAKIPCILCTFNANCRQHLNFKLNK